MWKLALGAVASLAIVLVFLCIPGKGPSLSLEKSAEIGRYQTDAAGSRTGPQRLGYGFRLDTMTGKAWRIMVLYDGYTEGWVEILEPEGAAAAPGSEIGRYRLAADLVSSKIGQESASAVRMDTVTGKAWYLQAQPLPMRWVSIQEKEETKGKAPAEGTR